MEFFLQLQVKTFRALCAGGFSNHEHGDFWIISHKCFFVFFWAFQVTSMEISQLFSWGLFVVCLPCFDDDHDDDSKACCNGIDTEPLDSLVAWVDDRPHHITIKVMGSIPS
jgi:hypothetical protein